MLKLAILVTLRTGLPLILLPIIALPQSRPGAPPEGARDRGITLLQSGNFQKAADEFQIAIGSNPRDAVAHDGLGVALAELGRTTESISEFQKAVGLSDGFASAHFHLALAYDRTDQVQPAVREYETVLRLEPGNTEARYALSGICWKLGDREGAIALLRQVVRGNVRFAAEAWQNLGLELREVGQLDEAAAALRSALSLAPQAAASYTALGRVQTEKGDFRVAVENLRRATALAPDDGECHYTLAEALRLSEDLEGAAAEFHRAIELNPRSSKSHRQLGIVLRQRGDYDGARRELERAVAIDPDDAQAYYYLGSVRLKLNDTEGAIAALTRSVDLNGYDSASRLALANALSKAGRNSEAEEQRRKASDLKEVEANAGQSRVLLGSAVEHLNAGDIDSAIGELRQAVKLSPEYPQAHTELALALLRKGSHDAEAVQILRRALELKDDAQGHLQLGLALEKTGQRTEALNSFRQAAQMAPSTEEAHRELAKAAMAAGDWKSVIEESTAILAWDSDDAEARRNLAVAQRHLDRSS